MPATAAPNEPRLPPAASSASRLAWSATLLGVALLAATLVEPGWPVALAETLRRLGGAWRWIALPGAVAGAALVLALNWLRPGVTWATLLRWLAAGGPVRRPLPGVAALVVGLGAAGYSAGLLSPSGMRRGLILLGIQLALFPGTPMILVLAAVAGTALFYDARGERLVDRAQRWWAAMGVPPPRAFWSPVGSSLALVATALAGGVLAASVLPPAMQGWGRADGPEDQRYSFYTSFFNYSFNDTAVVERQGYELGERGLVLQPQAGGSITFRLARPPESLVLFKGNFYHRCFDRSDACPTDVAFTNALEVSTEGETFWPVLTDSSVGEVVGNPVQDLSPLLGASRTYWLRFRASNTTPYEVTVLPSFVVSVVVDPDALPHPLFPIVAYAGGGAALGYLLAQWKRRPRREPAILGIAAAVLVTLGALLGRLLGAPAAPLGAAPADTGAPPVPLLFDASASPETTGALWAARAGAAAVILLTVAVARFGSRERGVGVERRRFPWLGIAALAVGLVALDARWGQLMAVRYEHLLPDAQGYQAIAVEFPKKLERYRAERSSPVLDEVYAAGFDGRASVPAVFYAGGNNGREPFWPAVLRLVFNVLGVSAFHTRLTSLLCGALVAVLTCRLGWVLVHPWAGITAGLLVATNGSVVVNSIHGLREELVSALLLLLLGALFAGAYRQPAGSAGATDGGAARDEGGLEGGRRRQPWWRVGVAAVAASAVILTRADMVILGGGIVTLAALGQRWRPMRWIATVAVIGLLAGPMYVGYAFTHGDAFYPGTYGATVNRNLEFPERMGTPGFPTAEEYAANWAAGPKVSPLHYFFGLHSPGQFVAYSVHGFQRIFRDVLFPGQPFVLALFVLGMLALLAARRWFVPFAVVVSLVPFYAFLAGVPNPWVFAPRYAHHALPYAAMAAAYALWLIPRWIVLILTINRRRRSWRAT